MEILSNFSEYWQIIVAVGGSAAGAYAFYNNTWRLRRYSLLQSLKKEAPTGDFESEALETAMSEERFRILFGRPSTVQSRRAFWRYYKEGIFSIDSFRRCEPYVAANEESQLSPTSMLNRVMWLVVCLFGLIGVLYVWLFVGAVFETTKGVLPTLAAGGLALSMTPPLLQYLGWVRGFFEVNGVVTQKLDPLPIEATTISTDTDVKSGRGQE